MAQSAKKLSEAKARAAKDAAKKSSSKSSSSSKKTSKSDNFNYSKMGISKDQWNSLDPNSKTAIGAIGDVLSKQMEQNQTIPTVLDTNTLNDLWAKAEADPTISSYYGEELTTAKQDFQTNMQAMQTQSGATLNQISQQQLSDQKALQEAQAAAGTAQSGFRSQAEKKLSDNQSGVLSSTRSQIQQNLQSLTSQFEKRYGTAALQQIGVPSITGVQASPTGVGIQGVQANAYGNIAGTQATDILSAKENKYQSLQQDTLQQQGAFETNKPVLPNTIK